MTAKERLSRLMIVGLFVLALGGWLLHLRIHSLKESPVNIIPFLAGLATLTVIPILFALRRTLPYAYVLNGMLVIIGIITMSNLSLAYPPQVRSLDEWLLGTTFPDSVILLGQFILGKSIFELNSLRTAEDPGRKGRFWRYPNMGWWWVHVAGLSLVYFLGHALWPWKA